MKHLITLTMLAALVAPNAYAMQAQNTSAGSDMNRAREEKTVGASDILPTQVRAQIENMHQGTPTPEGKATGDTFGHVQAVVRELPIANALKARIENRMASSSDTIMGAFRVRAEEHLSDIPAWITGVCTSSATASSSCEDIKGLLKEKCETLETAVLNTSAGSQVALSCADIDTLSCDDISARCEHIRTESKAVTEHVEAIKEKIQEKRGDLEEWKEEKKEVLAQNVRDRIAAYVARMIARIEAAANRLENFIARIEEGNDTSDVADLLSSAQTHINTARDFVSKTAEAIEDALASDTQRESVSILKEALKAAADELRDAHKDISTALDIINPDDSTYEESE